MYGVAQHFQNFMQSGPPLVEWVLLLFVVAPPATLLHELGHAIVARARLTGSVRLRVGPEPPLWTFELGGIEFRLRPLLRPIGVTGVCEYDGADVTAADAAVISLAGPGASVAGTLLSAFLLEHAAPGTLWHALCWEATMLQGCSTILCLMPFRFAERGGRVMQTDGLAALDALRHLSLSAPAVRAVRVAAPPTQESRILPPLPASPPCGGCGHRRDEHLAGGCMGQGYDFQSLASQACACGGYVSAN